MFGIIVKVKKKKNTEVQFKCFCIKNTKFLLNIFPPLYNKI